MTERENEQDMHKTCDIRGAHKVNISESGVSGSTSIKTIERLEINLK